MTGTGTFFQKLYVKMSEKLIGRVKNQVEIVITLWMLSFMNFKSVVNQMITPHNETCFLSDRFKKQQSQQKKCDFSANQLPQSLPLDWLPNWYTNNAFWLADMIIINLNQIGNMIINLETRINLETSILTWKHWY